MFWTLTAIVLAIIALAFIILTGMQKQMINELMRNNLLLIYQIEKAMQQPKIESKSVCKHIGQKSNSDIDKYNYL